MNSLAKALTTLCCLSFTTVSLADTDKHLGNSIKNGSSWQYSLSPYLWFAGLQGDMATLPGLPSAPIDISPKEFVDDSHISLMALFEAKVNNQGFIIDYMYSDIRSEEYLDPSIDFAIGSKSQATIVSTAYLYEAFNSDSTVIDLFTGVRYWKMATTIDISGDDSGDYDGINVSHSESWIDPLIGIKTKELFNNSDLYLTASATVGGFGVGSDMFYDASLSVGYQWNTSIGTSLGYRFYDLDYSSEGFQYDAKQHGVVLGLTWNF